MSTYNLYTIGYEGQGIEEFVLRLKRHGITRLIDVREIPISRKRGFSKSSLREHLKAENIQYVHIKALGSPSDIRNKLKSDWDYDSFFSAFAGYLNETKEAVAEAYQYLSDGINCIMCFEKNHEECHRKIVADRIKEFDGNGLAVKPL